MNKKNIALIYGGDSSEWEISVLSGKHMAAHVNTDKYNVYEVLLRGIDWCVVRAPGTTGQAQELTIDNQIDKNDFSFVYHGVKIRFDAALIMIHGTPGENGLLQSYFEMLHIPFTSSSAFVSALCFDKYACKCYLRDTGILMAKEELVRKGNIIDAEAIVAKLGLPLFVKPDSGGSSFGITKVKKASDLVSALEEAFKESSTVLIEEFISGRELTNGMLKTAAKSLVLPITEIVSDNDFFDYTAKYKGASKELTPAPISETLKERIQDVTALICDHLQCRGFIRIDYIVRENDIYFLEVNTVPGMTEMSLVPQQVRQTGMSIAEFLDLLIEDALCVSY